MPFYDYRCTHCEQTFEIQKGMNDNPKISCPHCRSRDCQRIFTPINTLGGENSGGSCSSCSTGACGSCSSK